MNTCLLPFARSVRALLLFGWLLLLPSITLGTSLDPAYVGAFGYGALVVSGRGFPIAQCYEVAQFLIRDGVSFIPGGGSATLNLRMILPLAQTVGTCFERLKVEKPEHLSAIKDAWLVFKIWPFFDESGKRIAMVNQPWPLGKGEEPTISKPCMVFKNIDEITFKWDHIGCSWEIDLGEDFCLLLRKAEAGSRMFASFHVAYEYQKLNGKTDYVYSEALASCSIEIEAPVFPEPASSTPTR